MTCLIELVVCSSLMLCVSLSDETMLAGDCGNDLLFVAIPVPLANPFASILMPLIVCLFVFLVFRFDVQFCSLHANTTAAHCIGPTRKCILPKSCDKNIFMVSDIGMLNHIRFGKCKQTNNQPSTHEKQYICIYRSQRHIKYIVNCVHIRYRYVHNRLLTIATNSKSVLGTLFASIHRMHHCVLFVFMTRTWTRSFVLTLNFCTRHMHTCIVYTFFAFQPIHSFIHSFVSNDSLIWSAHISFHIIGTNSYDTNYCRRICNIFWKFQPWSTGNYANKVWRTWNEKSTPNYIENGIKTDCMNVFSFHIHTENICWLNLLISIN